MPPASAHFKHRPLHSSSGPCNDQLPPAKRARESLPASVGLGKAPSLDDDKKLTGGSTPPAEKKVNVIRGKGHMDGENFSKGNYDISDPETLDCSICSHPLFLPVYQCRNGHTACPTCWSSFEKAKRSCHSCEEVTWDIRCIVVEKILEHLSVRCKNAVYGCNEFLGFLKKKEHEDDLCRHRPYKCAVHDCSFEGPKPSLLQHFDKQHQMQAAQIDMSRKVVFTMKSEEKYKLVQSDQELYMVYHEVVTGDFRGDIFYCASFGPYKRRYQLTVQLKSEERGRVAWGAVPEIKGLEEWMLKRDYITILESVQHGGNVSVPLMDDTSVEIDRYFGRSHEEPLLETWKLPRYDITISPIDGGDSSHPMWLKAADPEHGPLAVLSLPPIEERRRRVLLCGHEQINLLLLRFVQV